MTIKPVYFLLSILFIASLQSCSEAPEEPVQEVEQTVEEESSKHVLPPLPDTVMFCGEQYALDNFDVRERLDKEIIVNAFYHSSTIQYLKRAHRFFPGIEEALNAEGVPEDFKYLCLIESGLTQATSPSGAKGFWQFMPTTAKEYGLVINKQMDERLHVEKSTKAACQYLKDANAKFNNWLLTAASYNMGMGGVSNALEDQEVETYFDLHLNRETSRYIFRIFALKLIMENPEAYGFYPDEMELYDPIETTSFQLTESQDNLKHWAKEQGTTFHMLKVLNPWIKGDKLTCKKGDTLVVELPK